MGSAQSLQLCVSVRAGFAFAEVGRYEHTAGKRIGDPWHVTC